MDVRDLILRLYDIEAIKFGNFTLKSGIESPIYMDLRLIISYPLLLKAISEAMWRKICHIDFELLCGVPYTAVPIATALSLNHNIPMVMRRKEAKQYATKKIIEGKYRTGQRCVVVEDTITSGSSIIETVQPLKYEGIVVKDVVVIIDREQGGRENLEERGIKLHPVITLNEILLTLSAADKIDLALVKEVQTFIHHHSTVAVI